MKEDDMPKAELLEEYPLYRKFSMKLPEACFQLPKPAIHMPCAKCKSEQTFQMVNEYYDRTGAPGTLLSGLISRVIYKCAACHDFERNFMLLFSPQGDFVMKVGQHPAWSIGLDKKLSQMLGDHVEYYKNGLVCESQGYGIGAVAYFRRIVEEVIDTLLDQIAQIIPPADKDRYQKALEDTKKTIITQEKIDLVKDLLPPILRSDNVNPLGILHHSLSEGTTGGRP
jgi:hypothetical protein